MPVTDSMRKMMNQQSGMPVGKELNSGLEQDIQKRRRDRGLKRVKEQKEAGGGAQAEEARGGQPGRQGAA